MATLSELVNDFQGKIASIQQALKSPDAKTQSARLEQEIRSLYKEIAVGIKHLNALHDSVKSLIDQYKSAAVSDDESKVMIRSFVETMRTDSLGSSTYVAEGWNQICSGEFERAIGSLSNAVKLNPNDTRALGLLGAACLTFYLAWNAFWLARGRLPPSIFGVGGRGRY